MDTASLAPGVAPSTRDARHRAPRRRSSSVHAQRGRRPLAGAPVRDAFETWRGQTRGARFGGRAATLALAALAVADLLVDSAPLRQVCWIAAVLVAGIASLLAV